MKSRISVKEDRKTAKTRVRDTAYAVFPIRKGEKDEQNFFTGRNKYRAAEGV